MTADPDLDRLWPQERIVVVSDDPPAVEAAVTELEALGALPAVMFERTRALRALSVKEPDLVVLDFGRSPEPVRGLLGSLEEVQPVLPGALHAAPVVVLAEGPIAGRIERDAWAPLHVAPHDDREQVRAALTAALHDAVAPPSAAAAPAAVSASPAGAAAAPPAPAPAAAAEAAIGPRLALVPIAAVVLLAAGGAAFFLLQSRPQAVPPSAQAATPAPASTPTPPTAAPTTAPATAPTTAPLAVPTSAPSAAPTTPPTAATEVPSQTAAPATTVPTAARATVPTGVPTSVPTTAPTAPPAPSPTVSSAVVAATDAGSDASTLPAGPAAVTEVPPTPARLPVTGSR